MSETPVPPDPGRDEDAPGTPSGPGDHPSLEAPGWRLVPCSPDWDEAYLAAMTEDEYPGDADLYEDPDNAPPAGLDDAELATLIAEARENAEDQARAAEAAARLGVTGLLAMLGSVAAGGAGRGCRGRRRASRVSPGARRPGSPPASRWIPRRAARRWPRSWRTWPGTMTGTRARPMMNCRG